MSAPSLPRSASFVRPAAAQARGTFLARVAAALALHRQRRRLGELDDRMLADIGVTRTAARSEASRPAWDAPDRWLR